MRLPFRHARTSISYSAAARTSQPEISLLRSLALGGLWPGRALGLANVDRSRVEGVLEMNGVELFDHLDAGPAVLGYLVDIRAFHQAETNVSMPQTIG